MLAHTETPNKTSALTAKLNASIKILAESTDAASRTDAFKAYLANCAKFHNYSFLNQLLISWACPTATKVAGYNDWIKKFHRNVKKGEHGIPILAPIVVNKVKGDPDSGQAVFFKVVYVFDAAQTDGQPLPPEPEWKSPERLAWLETQLLKFAAAKQITVKVESLGNTQGVSSGGSITLDPTAGTKTLVHELAHELLHKRNSQAFQDLTREEKELEAEATGWVVCHHFGFDASGSANYLALWNADGKKIRQHFERIQHAATEIISAVSPELEGELIQ